MILLLALHCAAHGATLPDAREVRDDVLGTHICVHPVRDIKRNALVVTIDGAQHYVIVMGGGGDRPGTLYTWSTNRALEPITDNDADGTVDRATLVREDSATQQHRYDTIIAAVLTMCRTH